MAFTYSRALRFLQELEAHGVKLGLENVRVLLKVMGDPHQAIRTVIVGGTNGKGSVAAMLEAILRAAGHRVGLYTSPHLIDCRERIRVDGKPVSRADFARAVQEVAEAHDKAQARYAMSRPPTYFEAFTAMALSHFKKRQVDVAVLEVGMGGRFDATNVVTPLCAVITNVSLDHTQYLGRTVREIAQEKAGIIKPKVPVVTMARERALSVIRGRARQVGAVLHEAGSECRLRLLDGPDTNVIRLQTPVAAYEALAIALRGRHQVDNAVVAVRTSELLAERGIAVGAEAIRTGLGTVSWPGRLDLRDGKPATLLDAAHNPDGARTLRAYLSAARRRRSTVMLLGLTQGRDPKEMCRLLVPLAREVIVTRPPAKTSVDPERLAAEAARLRVPVSVRDGWQEALRAARRKCGVKDLLVVTGSLYLVGAAMGAMPIRAPR